MSNLAEFIGVDVAGKEEAIANLNWWLFASQHKTPERRKSLLNEYRACLDEIERHYSGEVR